MKYKELIELDNLIESVESCYFNCEFLSIAEKQQDDYYKKNKHKPPHICNLYNKQILHNGQHPHLPRLKECTF